MFGYKKKIVETLMKYFVYVFLCFLLTSCDEFQDIKYMDKHIYIRVPPTRSHFIHDPECAECKKLIKQADCQTHRRDSLKAFPHME